MKKNKKLYFHLFFWGGGGDLMHHRLFGEKIKKNSIFTPVIERERKYISSNDWLPGSFSYWYG